jgi:hypothetical protein
MELLQSDLTFSEGELFFIRQAIDLTTISAKDAKFVAQLQIKIETELQQMEQMKQEQLEEIKKSTKKKSA